MSFRFATILVALCSISAAAQTRRAAPSGDPFANRDEWQRVSDMIAALGPVEGKRIADIAAGKGYLTRPLAKAVGAKGRVFAVELGEEERRVLETLADSLTNIEVVASTETDPKLSGPIDGAIVLNSYHEFTNYRAMLEGIRRSLRPGALLVMVDNTAPPMWDAETRDFQASHHAIAPKFVEAELRAAGFEIAKRDDVFITRPIEQWLIVARRP
jgi:predicted methyltransferase